MTVCTLAQHNMFSVYFSSFPSRWLGHILKKKTEYFAHVQTIYSGPSSAPALWPENKMRPLTSRNKIFLCAVSSWVCSELHLCLSEVRLWSFPDTSDFMIAMSSSLFFTTSFVSVHSSFSPDASICTGLHKNYTCSAGYKPNFLGLATNFGSKKLITSNQIAYQFLSVPLCHL